MALPKHLARIEEKLDRVLAILDASTSSAPSEPVELDPGEVATLLEWDTYNAKELLARISSLTLDQRAAIAVYEIAHANRKTIVEALASTVIVP